MSQNNMAIQLNKGVIYLKSITGIIGPTYWLRAMSQRTHFSDNRQIITVRNYSSCGKVIISQVSVCPQGGRCTPPGRQTPPGKTHPGRHTPWVDTPPLGRHTSSGQTPPSPPPPEKATAADGTHPTGMHSCFKIESICTWLQCKVL